MRYDLTTIRLHWLTALLVVLLWGVGQTADLLPKGSIQNAYWSVHVVLGFVLALVLMCRLLWRASAGHRVLPVEEGVLQTVAKLNHYLLYSLLLLVISLGVMNAFIRGYDLFGVVKLPQIGDADWKRSINDLHELAANSLILVAFFHAAAALFHHFVKRDDVLRRMMSESTEK